MLLHCKGFKVAAGYTQYEILSSILTITETVTIVINASAFMPMLNGHNVKCSSFLCFFFQRWRRISVNGELIPHKGEIVRCVASEIEKPPQLICGRKQTSCSTGNKSTDPMISRRCLKDGEFLRCVSLPSYQLGRAFPEGRRCCNPAGGGHNGELTSELANTKGEDTLWSSISFMTVVMITLSSDISIFRSDRLDTVTNIT